MKEVICISIDGLEYMLLDSINIENNTFNYFSNLRDPSDVCILKDDVHDGEECYSSLKDSNEFDYAMSLFYDKFHHLIGK